MISLQEAIKIIESQPLPFYVYILHRPDGSPFYIGKGSAHNGRRRIEYHEKLAKRGDTSTHKLALIRKLILENQEIKYSIDSYHHTPDDAYDREKELIAYYGRYDKGEGFLLNQDDGGRGIPNIGEETRLKMRNAKLGTKQTESHRKAIAKGNTGRIFSEESKLRISLSNKGQKRSEVTRQKQSEKAKLNSKKKWETRRAKYGPTGRRS